MLCSANPPANFDSRLSQRKIIAGMAVNAGKCAVFRPRRRSMQRIVAHLQACVAIQSARKHSRYGAEMGAAS